MPDLTYRTDGIFTNFLPETKDGEDAWRVIAEQGGGNARVLTIHLNNVLLQLRKAGYVVRKAKKSVCNLSDDQLLAELLA
jgi:hypothetical protein